MLNFVASSVLLVLKASELSNFLFLHCVLLFQMQDDIRKMTNNTEGSDSSSMSQTLQQPEQPLASQVPRRLCPLSSSYFVLNVASIKER